MPRSEATPQNLQIKFCKRQLQKCLTAFRACWGVFLTQLKGTWGQDTKLNQLLYEGQTWQCIFHRA